VTVGALVQARMSSSRLPGKVLRPLAGRPLLSYLLERLVRCESLQRVVVATSADASDDPIADFCASQEVECHRGSLDDVAWRFLESADAAGLDTFVRVNGDSPLLDQRLVDHGVELFLREHCDLATNLLPRSFPEGQSVEVISVAALRRAHADMDPADREHVTTLFYREAALFEIRTFSAPEDWSAVRLVVDTEDDAQTMERLLTHMDRPHWEYDCAALISLAQGVAG